ncbi:MAG: tetratricopeptide repeat protein [Bacteroidetes bacterium]|nr:MAG: tetratricopeptide repeat protein [Bacteroidota bacterium]
MKRDDHQQELHFLADNSFGNKDYETSEQYYHRLIEADPTEYSYHSGISFALRLQGKLDEAVASIDQAISLNPQDANLYWMRAAAMKSFACKQSDLTIQDRRETFRLSIPYEQTSLSLDPTSEEGWLDLIESRICILDFHGAIGDLGRSNRYIQRLRLIWAFLGSLAFILAGMETDPELDSIFFNPDASFSAWCLIELERLLKDLEQEGFDPSRLGEARVYLDHFIEKKGRGGLLMRLI